MDNILIILSGLIYTNKVMYNQAYKLAHYLKGNVSIKTLQVIEEKDVEKRKRFMVEPGYRKHAFRNFKLALLYGGAFSLDKALLPVTMVARHFSKQKDRRVRNELVSEIETDIKICEEKISDANGNGDNKEKYKLMRIKNKLERELLRVKTNSKYV